MRHMIRVALVLVALCAAYTAAWHGAAALLEDRVAGWIDWRRGMGDSLTHGDLASAGFPLSLEVLVPQAAWVVPHSSGPASLAAPVIRVRYAPWRPFGVDLLAPRGLNASHAGRRTTWFVDAAGGDLRLDFLDSGAVGRAVLSLDGPDAAFGAGGARLPLGKAARVLLSLEPVSAAGAATAGVKEPETLRARLSASGVEPAVSGLPLDGPASLEATLSLHGRLASPAAEDLVAWRDAGGTLEVRLMQADWSPLDVRAEGTFALDGGLRPEGAGTAHLRGLEELVDRLAAARRISSRNAAMVKLAAAAFARPSADGGRPAVRLPVTIQDGKMFLGPLFLLTVPPIPG
jgi:hypothetical protein